MVLSGVGIRVGGTIQKAVQRVPFMFFVGVLCVMLEVVT